MVYVEIFVTVNCGAGQFVTFEIVEFIVKVRVECVCVQDI